MTRDEAVAMIKLQLGFRSNQDTNIVTCLQLAQTQLELQPTKPWFLMSEDSYIRTEADEERIPLPDDFLEEVEDAVFKYVPDDSDGLSDEVDLFKGEYDQLRKNYKNWVNTTTDLESGAPEAYCLMGSYFRIFPLPDDDYLIRMIYYKKDTVLSSNVENGWLKHAPLLLMGKAGQMIAGGPLRDMDAVKVFQGWESQGALALFGREVSRDMANKRLQMGGSHI